MIKGNSSFKMAATSPTKLTITTLPMSLQSTVQTMASISPTSTKPSATPETDGKLSQKLLDHFKKEKFNTSTQGVSASSSTRTNPAASGASGLFLSRSKTAHASNQDIYLKKWKKMKRAIKDAIFVNGAICDEVLRTEEKLAKAKEERRFLLRKLLQYQSVNTEPSIMAVKQEAQSPASRQQKGILPGVLPYDISSSDFGGKPAKVIKRKVPAAFPASTAAVTSATLLGHSASGLPANTGIGGPSEIKKKHSGKDVADNTQARPKKGKGANKKTIPPLLLDSLGRPVFPMELGLITLHSIGEIVPDRLSFHCLESIYPVGYCITRVYASLHKLDTKCLYTCKISDDNDGPLFEIAAEDSSDIIFRGTSPAECHSQLLRAVNKSRGGNILPTDCNGLDFFGLSHPVVQNLIQSCPGSRKCSRYKWVKFEINKQETNDNVAVGTVDPAVSYDAFKSHIIAIGHKRVAIPSHVEQSTNLRSLLTKGSSGFA